MLIHSAGGDILPAPKVRQYPPRSILTSKGHHPGKFTEVFVQNPPFCCILGLQNIKWVVTVVKIFDKWLFIILSAVEPRQCRNQYRTTAWKPKFQTHRYIWTVCKIMILSSIVDIICILLVKLVKFLYVSHIICYRMDFWWTKVFKASVQHGVAVRLTWTARFAVWSEKESRRAVTDACIRWQRPTELTAVAIVCRTRTYSNVIK